MKVSHVLQEVFEYIQRYLSTTEITNNTRVSVCDLQENDKLTGKLVCVLPIRDAVAGQYVKQTRVSPEIQLVCYASTFYELAGDGQLDEVVRNVMLAYPDFSPPANFNLIRRFLATKVYKLNAFQSKQIYQFHIVDN